MRSRKGSGRNLTGLKEKKATTRYNEKSKMIRVRVREQSRPE